MGHYILIGIVIMIILVIQTSLFFRNRKGFRQLIDIFPTDNEGLNVIFENGLVPIQSTHSNEVLSTVINTLNNYLIKNKGAVSDYHLMKDIVDRNCDAKEEELSTQIPLPLYLGLVGTMLGILIGLGFLVMSGGLNNLLSIDSSEINGQGIEVLLGSVALAMVASIAGIIYTSLGTYEMKQAKAILEEDKNNFLSWIQIELLPNVSTSVSGALVKMTQNLTTFNNAFSQNTIDLREVLTEVTRSYIEQKKLMEYVNKLKLPEIVTTNLVVFDKLKDSTDQIGFFVEYLENANKYLKEITELSQKLDKYENRTQVIEAAGSFFQRNEKWVADSIDNSNLEMQTAAKRFNEGVIQSMNILKEQFSKQILSFNDLMNQQKERLGQKLDAFIAIGEEIKNLEEIKKGIHSFQDGINGQNKKIDDLTKSIIELAQTKSEGGKLNTVVRLPRWVNFLLIVSSSALVFYIFNLFLEFFRKG